MIEYLCQGMNEYECSTKILNVLLSLPFIFKKLKNYDHFWDTLMWVDNEKKKAKQREKDEEKQRKSGKFW